MALNYVLKTNTTFSLGHTSDNAYKMENTTEAYVTRAREQIMRDQNWSRNAE